MELGNTDIPLPTLTLSTGDRMKFTFDAAMRRVGLKPVENWP